MKTITLLFLSLFSFLLFSSPVNAEDSPQAGQQVEQRYVDKTDENISCHYLLFLPRNHGKQRAKLPLILFLHGAGERGSILELVKMHGPPKIVEKKPEFEFIVVSPQCPRGNSWRHPDQLAILNALLDDVISKYEVDTDRIYLTGLSMGGYGSWALAANNPERFAACVPICGGGKTDSADRLKHLPIWVFHGGKDTVVPLSRSQSMVEAIRDAGGDVKFTIYPEAGHNSWTKAYDDPELYKWFLRHTVSENQKAAKD